MSVVRLHRNCAWISIISVVVVLFGCSKKNRDAEKESQTKSTVLMQYDDSVLTQEEVDRLIPLGISSADSILMFNAIVDDWLSGVLLSDLARLNDIDMRRVERLVSEYRNQLIISRYREKMLQTNIDKVGETELKRYYDKHHKDLILERPIVRGVFLKISKDDDRINDVRRWMSRCSPSDIMNLEKYGLEHLLDYEYFCDYWLDWQTISEQFARRIPEPEEIICKGGVYSQENKNVETIIHVSDVIESGNEMPFEFAQQQIMELLVDSNKNRYENRLMSDLYKKAVSGKKLRIPNQELRKRYKEKLSK